MTANKPKLPRDANQLAKRVVDIATRQVDDRKDSSADSSKDETAVELGRRGGLRGGKARAKKLSASERSAIAKRAAEARWKNK